VDKSNYGEYQDLSENMQATNDVMLDYIFNKLAYLTTDTLSIGQTKANSIHELFNSFNDVMIICCAFMISCAYENTFCAGVNILPEDFLDLACNEIKLKFYERLKDQKSKGKIQ
jgi:hypothetical protein